MEPGEDKLLSVEKQSRHGPGTAWLWRIPPLGAIFSRQNIRLHQLLSDIDEREGERRKTSNL